jgi:hypothetical protein
LLTGNLKTEKAMNKEQFTQCLHSPEKLKNTDLADLTMMVNDFPYCSTLRILKTVKLFLDKNVLFESELKTTAIYAGSRKILKRHIDRMSDEKMRIVLPDEVNTGTVSTDKKEETSTQKSPGTKKSPEQKNQSETKETVVEKTGKEKKEQVNRPATKPDEKTDKEVLKKPVSGKKLSLEELKKIVEDRIREIEKEKNKKTEKQDEKVKKFKTTDEIIDNFIKNNPSISRPKVSFFDPMESAKESVVDKENIVSETLAKIYMDQGHYQKAINIFKKLSLKYPEKSSYFAALIEKAKKSLEN